MNIANLGVGVDPSAAKAGVAEVNRALDSMGAKARDTMGRFTAATNQAKAATNQQAAATQGAMSRMTQSMLGFFRVSQSGATATQRALGGMVGSAATFLQRIAGFMPGATGAFIGLAGGVGRAATAMTAAAGASLALLAALGLLAGAVLAVGAAFLAWGATIVMGDRMVATLGRINAGTKDLKAARAVYDQLYKTSLQTGQSIDTSAASFTRFSIAARSIGASNQQVLDLVETIQKVGITSGASVSEIASASQQLGQALASGRFQGDELRSVLENLPALAEKLAAELGVGIGELRKMGEEGKLTASNVFPALLRTTQSVRKEFAAMPMTLGRAWGSLGTLFSRMLADIDQMTGSSQAISNWLKDGIEKSEQLRVSLRDTARGAIMDASWDDIWAYVCLRFEDAWNRSVTAIGESIKSAIGEILKNLWKDAVEGMKMDLELLRRLGDKLGLNGLIKDSAGVTSSITKDPVFAPRGSRAPNFDAQGNPIVAVVPASGPTVNATSAFGPDITPGQRADIMERMWQQRGSEAFRKDTEADLTKTGKVTTSAKSWTGTGQAPKTDAQIMADFVKELAYLKANSGSQREFSTRSDALKDQTAGALGDPMAYAAALDKWRAFKAQQEQIAASTDRRIEAGQETLFASMERGIQRATEGWSNLSLQVSNAAGQIATSLSGNIAGALGDIATGAKDAKTAFRDMALAIVQDIIRICIQLLVELAIGMALKALGLAGGGGAAMAGGGAAGGGGWRANAMNAGGAAGSLSSGGVGSSGSYTSGGGFIGPTLPTGSGGSQAPTVPTGGVDFTDFGGLPGTDFTTPTAPQFRTGFEPNSPLSRPSGSDDNLWGDLPMAKGGRVWGGRGGIDDIPARLTRGEYVIPKDAAEYYGAGFLEAVRTKRFADGGPVGPIRPGSGGGRGDVNFTFQIDARGSSGGTNEKEETERLKKLGKLIEAGARQEIARQKRSGGLLNSR